ncbi:flagellar biosynthesis anti-sigma factor FlgM [Zoogloea sp. LCSB751]|uniref:flagellar biosynthesis anti-sigma factor FlgM n=1 Tax=Zoogloea sp. LCSB751 TaxID=1965277 RepID=UPI0009A50AFE|nr:flagellar biosynthesis anti-sigma factor FlgM [Zoogloea sp. LCSB751]
MKISGPSVPMTSAAATSEVAPVSNVPAVTPAASAAEQAPLQSAGLLQAKAALQSLPEIDQAKVDALREALAKGELPFDAGKLAGLIDRYHGSRS